MATDKGIGMALLIGSIAGVIVYGWLLWSYSTVILQVTAFIAVASLLAVLAWIGWTMATTNPPPPLTEDAPKTSSSSELRFETKEGK